jgi:hypothetical protein
MTRKPSAMYALPSAKHIARSGIGVPPRDDSRIAFIPQVGASAHEMGRTQPGKKVSGTRNPQISQTGYSNMFPSAHAARKRTKQTANRKPSAPNVSTVAGIENANRRGWTTVRSTPKRRRPQSSVATRL